MAESEEEQEVNKEGRLWLRVIKRERLHLRWRARRGDKRGLAESAGLSYQVTHFCVQNTTGKLCT